MSEVVVHEAAVGGVGAFEVTAFGVDDVSLGFEGSLPASVTRLAREVQTVRIHDKVKAGELDYKQGERLMAFLDLERLGIAADFYPSTVYQARRREARKLGYSPNDSGLTALQVDLDQLLAPYKRVAAGAADAVPGASQVGGR